MQNTASQIEGPIQILFSAFSIQIQYFFYLVQSKHQPLKPALFVVCHFEIRMHSGSGQRCQGFSLWQSLKKKEKKVVFLHQSYCLENPTISSHWATHAYWALLKALLKNVLISFFFFFWIIMIILIDISAR